MTNSARRRVVVGGCLAALLLGAIAVAGQGANGASAGHPDRSAAQEIVALTNAVRARNGVPVLAPDARLTQAAEAYAADMAARDWFDHLGPEGSTVVTRVEAAGYVNWTYLGENLARGAGPPGAKEIVAGWLDSPGHRDNLLSPVLREIGVGCYARSQPEPTFWCAQAFGSTPRQEVTGP